MNKCKMLGISLIIVSIILLVASSIATGFYGAICETGFDPLACIFLGYFLGFVGLISGGICLTTMWEE